MVAQTETPKKKSRKSIPEKKKYKKRTKHDEEEQQQQNEFIEFVEEEEEEEAELEVVALGGHLSSGMLTSEQNRIRENIAKKKLVRKGQLFHLPICSIHRPPVDPESGRRPLEIREPHAVHVQNLKSKMKINPHATVVPFLVMVDPDQCPPLPTSNTNLQMTIHIMSSEDPIRRKLDAAGEGVPPHTILQVCGM